MISLLLICFIFVGLFGCIVMLWMVNLFNFFSNWGVWFLMLMFDLLEMSIILVVFCSFFLINKGLFWRIFGNCNLFLLCFIKLVSIGLFELMIWNLCGILFGVSNLLLVIMSCICGFLIMLMWVMLIEESKLIFWGCKWCFVWKMIVLLVMFLLMILMCFCGVILLMVWMICGVVLLFVGVFIFVDLVGSMVFELLGNGVFVMIWIVCFGFIFVEVLIFGKELLMICNGWWL